MHVVDFVTPDMQSQCRHFGNAVNVGIVGGLFNADGTIHAVAVFIQFTLFYNALDFVIHIIGGLNQNNTGQTFKMIIFVLILVICLHNINKTI